MEPGLAAARSLVPARRVQGLYRYSLSGSPSSPTESKPPARRSPRLRHGPTRFRPNQLPIRIGLDEEDRVTRGSPGRHQRVLAAMRRPSRIGGPPPVSRSHRSQCVRAEGQLPRRKASTVWMSRPGASVTQSAVPSAPCAACRAEGLSTTMLGRCALYLCDEGDGGVASQWLRVELVPAILGDPGSSPLRRQTSRTPDVEVSCLRPRNRTATVPVAGVRWIEHPSPACPPARSLLRLVTSISTNRRLLARVVADERESSSVRATRRGANPPSRRRVSAAAPVRPRTLIVQSQPRAEKAIVEPSGETAG